MACRATLRMLDCCSELNAAWRARGAATLRTRFGLHTGEAVVGFVGSRDRLSCTAPGATVNLASRLEALNRQPGSQILISDAVARGPGGRFLVRTVGLVQPKGPSTPQAVFELLDKLDASGRPLRRPELAGCAQTFEEGVAAFRAQSWAKAADAFDAVLAQRPGAPPPRRCRARVGHGRTAPPDAAWSDAGIFMDQ